MKLKPRLRKTKKMHPNQSRQQEQRGCPVHTVGRGDQSVNERGLEKSEGKDLLEKWKPKVGLWERDICRVCSKWKSKTRS